jgi:hypothetical protein
MALYEWFVLLFNYFGLIVEPESRGLAMEIPWSGCCEQLPSGLTHVQQRCQDLDLAAVLGKAAQSGVLKPNC